MTLPYDMGNAGDLLKHGVLAEFVRWQCELDTPLRFMDPFGGEPWGQPVPEVVRRIRALATCTLRVAQSDIDNGRYYGSGLLVQRVAKVAGARSFRVLSGDASPMRRERLHTCGLSMLDEEFAAIGADSNRGRYDGYAAFRTIVHAAQEGDLVLMDPFFDDFVEQRAPAIIPQAATMAERAAVLLFLLNPEPRGEVGQRFDALLVHHLRDAWRLTCPPLSGTSVRGEARFHAEVILASRPLLERERTQRVDVLRRRLTKFAMHLAVVLGVPSKLLELRIIGH